jgi:hypothetical protein
MAGIQRLCCRDTGRPASLLNIASCLRGGCSTAKLVNAEHLGGYAQVESIAPEPVRKKTKARQGKGRWPRGIHWPRPFSWSTACGCIQDCARALPLSGCCGLGCDVEATRSSGQAMVASRCATERARGGTIRSPRVLGRAFDQPFGCWTGLVTTFFVSALRNPDLIAWESGSLRAGQVWICRDRQGNVATRPDFLRIGSGFVRTDKESVVTSIENVATRPGPHEPALKTSRPGRDSSRSGLKTPRPIRVASRPLLDFSGPDAVFRPLGRRKQRPGCSPRIWAAREALFFGR